MIDVRSNLLLKEKFYESRDFVIGVELVSTRGTMTESKSMQARAFSEDLTHSNKIDWVSITDNAGGNPQLSPVALGTPILFGGKEVVVHMTCKDLNRHGLESQLWLLSSHGFNNILALTGDYPLECYRGKPKPVFDIDSVGLLKMIDDLNGGLEVTVSKKQKRLGATNFFAGAVTTNFKYSENMVIPQYLKLEKNESYWQKGKPYLDRVTIRIVPEISACIWAPPRVSSSDSSPVAIFTSGGPARKILDWFLITML